jgi:hypothetical protein
MRALLAAVLLLLLARNAVASEEGDTDFLFRLGMMEGHLIVGHDLLAAGKPELAIPHFGHPVRELYEDISGYLTEKRFPAFDKQLIRLEATVTAAPRSPEAERQYAAVIETLHKARLTVPAQIRDSVPDMIKVCADTIDAASGEYGEAVNQGRVDSLVEYHDSRGYVSFVTEQVDRMQKKAADPASRGLIARFKTVLAKARWIVEPLMPADPPRASIAEYRAVAAEAVAVAKP